jgi:predicted AAA+ superfamily ATPase
VKRILYKKLTDWKNNPKRKPLLLQGARQVGKTYLIKEFAKNEYENLVYLNFEENKGLKSLFVQSLNAKTIIENIELYIGRKISFHNSIIFFDEIQIVPDALTSLKYFNEQLPEYHVISAGSLLGVSVGKQQSFPVGKVNFLNLYPMSFLEYLYAFDEDLLIEKLLKMNNVEMLPEIIHEKLIKYLMKYLFLGGMPEVLQTYLDTKDINLARKIQEEILEAYKRDFSKYTDRNQAIKTSELWLSIPYQLSKENKKFKYKDVRKNARASNFEQTIEWLRQAGLINIVYNLKTPKIPIAGYTDFSKFKIYLLDTGLLGAMLNLSSDIIIRPNDYFKEYNGAFIENYVASELTTNGYKDLFYWKSKNDAEVDYIIQHKNSIIPLEVKSGTSRNIKSLRSYEDKYNPKLIIRISPRNFIQDEKFINIPLYSVFAINNVLNAS